MPELPKGPRWGTLGRRLEATGGARWAIGLGRGLLAGPIKVRCHRGWATRDYMYLLYTCSKATARCRAPHMHLRRIT